MRRYQVKPHLSLSPVYYRYDAVVLYLSRTYSIRVEQCQEIEDRIQEDGVSNNWFSACLLVAVVLQSEPKNSRVTCHSPMLPRVLQKRIAPNFYPRP